jgi:hypothetical protein
MGEIAGAIGAVAFFGYLAVAERRKRELEHTERMKRLELGLADPTSDAQWARALVCAAIGFGVPLSAFVATLIAYLNKDHVADEIWIAPSLVSVASVIAGATLAGHLFRGGPSSAPGADALANEAAHANHQAAKPPVDADAFDVVGRRG